MKLFIKNMVCGRCKLAVDAILKDAGYNVVSVNLGEVTISNELSKSELQYLNKKLQSIGFELLEDEAKKQIEKIKQIVIEKIETIEIAEDFKLSDFIPQQLYKDYSSLSKLFSQNEGITLEHFFILQKVEKAKELLFYNLLSLTQIASMLGYKSVQHLSAQFKKVTGLTPSVFKQLKQNVRKPLDRLS